jgi:hypothetical protein
MRAQQGRRDATGVTAEPIELIERPADTPTRNTSRATEARKEADPSPGLERAFDRLSLTMIRRPKETPVWHN